MSNVKWSPLREHLIEFTSGETGMNQTDSCNFVTKFLGLIVDHVRGNDVTEIRGFGSFRWTLCKARTFKGGLFGKRTIPAYRKLTFRSAKLKGRNVNGK